MKLLAIDTSGPVCGVAVLSDGAVVCEQTVANRLTHSANLLPMIDTALTASGLTLADMDRLACVTGPGSFTGVRIGVSTLKGLAHGCGKPCVGVDALEAMAAGISGFDGLVVPLQDARAGQVYAAAFTVCDSRPARVLADQPISVNDLAALLPSLGERFLFLGDGMPVHRACLTELLGSRAFFAAPQHAFLRPSAVAVLAAEETETLDYRALMPMYLRAPNAERNKKLVEAAEHA